MLAEVDEQREAIRAELRAVEDEAEVLRRMEAARESLAQPGFATYDPVHAEWYEDPDAARRCAYLCHGSRGPPPRLPQVRRRFEVDKEGNLTLQLSLGLDGEVGHMENSS